jgi:hypothetical protein
MKRKILTATLSAVAALALVAGPAAAAPGNGPADGKCVSNGVKALGGPTIAAVANGTVDLGEGVTVDVVIRDHAFNNADTTESILGITICK